MRMAWNGPIHKHWNLIYWLAPFIKSFSKGIKIALKENTLIFFSFSGLQFPGQTACKTCCCSTYGQLIWAESSRQVFSICFEKQENQPAANISQKSQIPTNSGMRSLQHQHRAPLPTLCPTGSCILLLHLQTSLSHVSALLNYRKSLWAHTAHPLRCKRKQHPPRLPKGRNIKGTSVRSNPVPTEATTNSSARAGSRTGPMLSFYLFLNLLPSAPKQVRWEFFRIVFWHQSQKQIREHMNFLQLFGEGKEGVWRC